MSLLKNPYIWVQFALVVSGLLFASSSLSYWLSDYSWLEQQRITQLLLAATGSLACLGQMLRPEGSRITPTFPLMLALLLGMASALLAQFPDWALKEWAKYSAMVGLVLALGIQFQKETAQKFSVGVLLVVSLMLATQFFSFYLASFFSGTKSVSPYLMYPGFDNPRFYGQFQAIAIPLLHGLSLHKHRSETIYSRWLIGPVLILQWSIAWALAGRGVMLGLLVASIGLFVVAGTKYFKLLLQVGLCGSIGFVLYWLLFFFIPEWGGLANEVPSGLRFGLSKRDFLWSGAWEMSRSNPLLGVGPLHFSAVWNHVGAHPHQAILQFSAEWGIPATLMLLWVVVRSMLRGIHVIRVQSSGLDVGIWLALVSSLTLAQVDGVFVMPYTEGWLALIGGLALARWRTKTTYHSDDKQWPRYVLGAMLFVAILVIAKVLILDVPVLHETYKLFYEKHQIGSPPRFWDQGWIPM